MNNSVKHTLPDETASTIHLLFVEDDEDDFILTSELLQQSELLDFDIEWVATAAEARDALARNRHDICLMDHRLGPELGINLVRDAVMLGFSAPIIMLTGQRNTGVEIEAAEAGAVDFLVKDELSLEQLQRAIRYALARSEIQAERFERLRAESANRSKSEFLATLSHEIRTPLTAILGYTELLMDQYAGRDEDLTANLSIIDRNGKHLLSLLNNTLDLSKIEAGKFEIEIRAVELGPFLADIVSLIKLSAEEKGLQFSVNCLSDLPGTIRTDGMRLRQILLNLLGNAIKFTHQGKVELSIELISREQGHTLYFTVRDTGNGISPAHLQDIFDPFSQLPNDDRFQQGTGLGLTISLRLAERLGGTINVESTLGEGSQFTLSIDPGDLLDTHIGPVDLSTAVNTSVIEQIEGIEGKVLIVDDVEDVRTLIGNILTKAGVEIAFATNGREAVDLLRKDGADRDYALVLMDLNMPVMNGYEAMDELNKAGVRVPAVALTAASLQGEREKCMEAGFRGYISKPITASNLIAVISATLDQARGQDQNDERREAQEDTRKEAAGASGSGASEAAARHHRRILVVEDNPDANDALCLLLRHLGNEVLAALYAGEAMELCGQHPPDIALVDINLPDANGLSLCERIHQALPATRLILVSGHSLDEQETPSFIDSCIIKPVNLPSLQAALQEKEGTSE